MHLLVHLTSLAVPVVTLPTWSPLTASPVPSPALQASVGAGRGRGKLSPQLDNIYTDGSFRAFNVFQQLHLLADQYKPGRNFLANFTDERFTDHPITWQWLQTSF